MPNNLPNTKIPQTQKNIYTNQHKQTTPAKKPRDVWQDKGAVGRARPQANQPAPLTKGSRALSLNNQKARSQKGYPTRVKLIHTTLHLHPIGRGELERAAQETGVSVSAVGNQVIYDWAISRGEQKYKTTLKAELRHMFREELAAFGHRIVFFLLRIAMSAEQARILVTNVLKVLLQSRGKYDEKNYLNLVDQSAKLAKRNVIKKTPQLKTLFEEWETAFADGRGEEARR